MRCVTLQAGALLLGVLAAAPCAAQALQEASRPPPPPGAAPTADEFQPLPPTGDLTGRTYYLLETGLTCRSNTPDHTRIRTWRERIEFRDSTVLVWGDLCNDAATELPLAAVQAELRIRAGLDAVLFRNRTLVYAAAPPKLCDAGLWCPVSDPGDGK